MTITESSNTSIECSVASSGIDTMDSVDDVATWRIVTWDDLWQKYGVSNIKIDMAALRGEVESLLTHKPNAESKEPDNSDRFFKAVLYDWSMHLQSIRRAVYLFESIINVWPSKSESERNKLVSCGLDTLLLTFRNSKPFKIIAVLNAEWRVNMPRASATFLFGCALALIHASTDNIQLSSKHVESLALLASTEAFNSTHFPLCRSKRHLPNTQALQVLCHCEKMAADGNAFVAPLLSKLVNIKDSEQQKMTVTVLTRLLPAWKATMGEQLPRHMLLLKQLLKGLDDGVALLPTLEKVALRSAAVAVKFIRFALVSIDGFQIFEIDGLWKIYLTLLRSENDDVRYDALACVYDSSSFLKDTPKLLKLTKAQITDIIDIYQDKKATIKIKESLANALASIDVSPCLPCLLELASKETSENALEKLVLSIANASWCDPSATELTCINNVFLAGLRSSKLPVKTAWITGLSMMLQTGFAVEEVGKILATPSAVASNGLACAYSVLLSNNCKFTLPVESPLFLEKIYVGLSIQAALRFVKVLLIKMKEKKDSGDGTYEACITPIIWWAIYGDTAVQAFIREQFSMIEDVDILKTVSDQLTTRILKHTEDDSISTEKLVKAVGRFLRSATSSSIHRCIPFLTVCHLRVMRESGLCAWTMLFSRSIESSGFDQESREKLWNTVKTAMNPGSRPEIVDAIRYALQTLMVVDGKSFALIVCQEFFEAMESLNSQPLTLEETMIWSAKDYSTPVVDVLGASFKKTDGSASTLKKFQSPLLSRTTGSQLKSPVSGLTKSGQSLVDAQLLKEQDIRTKVQARMDASNGAIKRLISATTGNPHAFSHYVGELTWCLLSIILNPSNEWCRASAVKALYAIARCNLQPLFEASSLLITAFLVDAELEGFIERDWDMPCDRSALSSLLLKRLSTCAMDDSTFVFAYAWLHRLLLSPTTKSEIIQAILAIIERYCERLGNETFKIVRMNILKALLIIIERVERLAATADSLAVTCCEAVVESDESDDFIAMLLEKLLADSIFVRLCAIRCLECFGAPADTCLLKRWKVLRLLAMNDDNEEIRTIASLPSVADGKPIDIPANYAELILPYIQHQNISVVSAACRSISSGISTKPETSITTVNILMETYHALRSGLIQPDLRGKTVDETFPTRKAIATILSSVGATIDQATLKSLFEFIIGEAFYDPNAEVHGEFLQATTMMIEATAHHQFLVALLESHLSSRFTSSSFTAEEHDRVRVFVVIVLGRLAQHLPTDDPRLPVLMNSLASTLSIPSESVQVAIARSLATIFKSRPRTEIPAWTKKFVEEMQNPKNGYASRKGAAFGLAAIVLGQGPAALHESSILEVITFALSATKKSFEIRQSGLLVIEILAKFLGRKFEAYNVYLVPMVLAGFGDSFAEVRQSTREAAVAMMANLSPPAVRMILPALLSGLSTSEGNWRTKAGSIEWLGAMASSMTPEALAPNLPQIIPPLILTLNDSHPSVQKTTKQALAAYGAIVRNPEIHGLVPVILNALTDPSGGTGKCLNAILATSFAHLLDTPSLALLEPVLTRALVERASTTDTKRKAAQIIGNLAQLTDIRDLKAFLPGMLVSLISTLGDPVPEVRSNAAKCLGILVRTLGEENFEGLVPKLIEMIKKDDIASGTVDRNGAAQALSEVLSSLGIDRLDLLLKEIREGLSSKNPCVREGFVMLIGFLPIAFSAETLLSLSSLWNTLIPSTLALMADETEMVRDASILASKTIVRLFATSPLVSSRLVANLLRGMGDERWRCRIAALQLVEELLERVGRIEKNNVEDYDASNATDIEARMPSVSFLKDRFGVSIFYSLLTALWLARFDSTAAIRHAALPLWKCLVLHPPRTLLDISPSIVEAAVNGLASSNERSVDVAQRALAELIEKMGDRILSSVLAQLSDLLSNSTNNPSVICGIILAAMTIARALTTRILVENAVPKLFELLQQALLFEDEQVRKSVAKLFDFVAPLLPANSLEIFVKKCISSDRHDSIEINARKSLKNGLCELIRVKGDVLLPVIIPIVKSTWKASDDITVGVRTTFALIEAAGPRTSRYAIELLQILIDADSSALLLDTTLPTIELLLSAIDISEDDSKYEADAYDINYNYSSDAILELSELLEKCYRDKNRSHWAFILIAAYAGLDTNISRLYDVWLRRLVSTTSSRVAESEDGKILEIKKLAAAALTKILDKVAAEDLPTIVGKLHEMLSELPLEDIFEDAPMVSSIVKLLVTTLVNPSSLSSIRLKSSELLGQLYQSRSSIPAMTNSTVAATGALIRLASDFKNPTFLRHSLLSSLLAQLTRCPLLIKPFYPQLQRLFIKSLADPDPTIRLVSIKAAAKVYEHVTRSEAMVAELIGLLDKETVDVPVYARVSVLDLLESIIVTRRFSDSPPAVIAANIAELVERAKLAMAERDPELRVAAKKVCEALIRIRTTAIIGEKEREELSAFMKSVA